MKMSRVGTGFLFLFLILIGCDSVQYTGRSQINPSPTLRKNNSAPMLTRTYSRRPRLF